MKRVKLIATALALIAVAVLASRVAAQETNTQERTFLTFSGPVEMPGVTLDAGTYVFKLADTQSRNVVQVWDKDEKHMVGHWLFVQAERPEVTGENVVMFKETREGSTPAVQFWYFPGEKIGKEFIYPKDQALKIAARTGVAVRTDEGVVEGGGIAAVEPQPSSVQADSSIENAPAPAQPTAAAGSLAGNRGVAETPSADNNASASASVSTDNSNQVAANADVNAGSAVGTSGRAEGQVARNDSQLPRTASPLIFSGLLGLISMAGAAGVRFFRS